MWWHFRLRSDSKLQIELIAFAIQNSCQKCPEKAKIDNKVFKIWQDILKIDYLMLNELILILKDFKMFNPPPTKKHFTSRLWTLELCFFCVSFFFGDVRSRKKNVDPKAIQFWAGSIWMFPKIVVPPNHPFLIGFSIINHPLWGTPIFGNIHMTSKASLQLTWWEASQISVDVFLLV